MVLSEYEPGAAFPWVLGRTTVASAPSWPQNARPALATPNVLVVVMDDTAFGQLHWVHGAQAAITPTPGLGDDKACGTYPAPVSAAEPV